MAEADEVGPHLLDLRHRAADHVVGHGCRDSRVVFVVVGAAEEQPLAIELEGAVRHPLHAPQAESLVHAVLAVRRGERHGAGVELGRRGRPGGRRGNREGVEFLLALPRSGLQFTAVDQHAGWITDLDRDRHLVGEPLGVVEPATDRATPLSVGEYREHVHLLKRHRRHVHEVDVPVEAAVAVEVAEVGGDRFRIPRVVAADRQRHLPLARLVCQRARGGVGDVERPLVVATQVAADLGEAHEHARRLTGAVEVEERAATGEWILRLQPRAIPAVPLVIPLVGIDGVAGIETVGQRNLRPGDVVARLVTSPHLPHAAERAAVVLPAVGQALPLLGGGHGPTEDRPHRRER